MTREEIEKRAKCYTNFDTPGKQLAAQDLAIKISNAQIDEAIEIVNYPWETTNADIIITAITHRLEQLKIS